MLAKHISLEHVNQGFYSREFLPE